MSKSHDEHAKPKNYDFTKQAVLAVILLVKLAGTLKKTTPMTFEYMRGKYCPFVIARVMRIGLS